MPTFMQVSTRITSCQGLLLLLLGLVMQQSGPFMTSGVCNAGNLLVLKDGRIGFIVSGPDLVALKPCAEA